MRYIIKKLFENLLLKRIKSIIEEKEELILSQFGFKNKHSIIDQVHRIINVIEKDLEENKVCSTIFLDVAHNFEGK